MPTTRKISGRVMAEQLPLTLSSQQHATFENYHGCDESPSCTLLQSLEQEGAPRLLYLWGGTGVGKSHLLHATCTRLEKLGIRTLYLPLKVFVQYSASANASLLAGLSLYQVLVMDDLHAVVGGQVWEETLFHLLNQARDQQQQLVVSGARPLAELGVVLPDLRSRLAEAVTQSLQPLTAEEKWKVVQQRADERGMKIGDEVVHYLINRTERDFHTLFSLLDRLDQQTLIAQRKITIPFVRELLEL